MLINPSELTSKVIGRAIAVHRELGPGLLESAYARCLQLSLQEAGLEFACEVPIPVTFQGTQVDCAYRADLIVERALLVEIKSVSRLDKVHHAQTLTYLRLLHLREGLLINFNVSLLKHGIRRFL